MTDLTDHEQDLTRCLECGAPLTAPELQRVVDDGLPPLCTVHAAEREAAVVPEDDETT